MLYLKRLYARKRAVTALLGYHQKPNRAVNRSNSNRSLFRDRAVKIAVHFNRLIAPPHCVNFFD